MEFSIQQAARLILAEAVINSEEGSWIFDDKEILEKYGVHPYYKKVLVDTINQMYPGVLLDDPIYESPAGQLSLVIGQKYTLAYWNDPNCTDKIDEQTEDFLNAMEELYASYESFRLAERARTRASVALMNADREVERMEERRKAA